MSSTRKNKKFSRSRKLKKYGLVYQSFLKEKEKKEKSGTKYQYIEAESSSYKQRKKTLQNQRDRNGTNSRRRRHISNHRYSLDSENTSHIAAAEKVHKDIYSKNSRKYLNPYQIFVRQESKKVKYLDMPGKERLIRIAQEWKSKKSK